MNPIVRRYFDKSVYAIYLNGGVLPFKSEKVYAFDLDSTLIQTRTGKIHSIAPDDYQWGTGVLTKLKELSDTGAVIVVFSNQSGISSKGNKLKMLYTKIINLLRELQVESIETKRIVFFLAAKYDWNRKPSPSMWNLFVNKFNSGVVPKDTLFVGDAAGRPNDFSCSDRKFARNCGIKFFTPEQFFLNQEKEDFEWGGYDPQGILKEELRRGAIRLENNFTFFSSFPGVLPMFKPADTTEMIICVGFPGAGKSTWFEASGCKQKGYTYINQDTLGTPGKCKKVCLESLTEGKSVYVDNTNLSTNTRKQYIDMSKKTKIPVRCVWFNSPIELCKHLNKFRSYLKKTTTVPHVAYNNAAKSFVQPTIDEGFKEIITVPFVPKFNNDRELRVFKYRW